MDRREFLRVAAGMAGALTVGGCRSSGPEYVQPGGPQVAAAAARRGGAGPVRAVRLVPAPAVVDLGGRRVSTWTYGGELPGAAIRVRRGETVEARLVNRLPAETSVHWHGIALRNDMDGMPGVTQPAIVPQGQFTYRFVADQSGTYFFHPHSGVQLDRGLYAPLIIEDPDEPGDYDEEWVIVLDDWLDGVNDASPERILAELRSGMGHGGMSGMDPAAMSTTTPSPASSPEAMPGMDMPGMDMPGMGMPSGRPDGPRATTASPPPRAGRLMGAKSQVLGGDAGDVAYPYHLVNGRTTKAPQTFRARPGCKLRIRIINAASDTGYRFAVGGHTMTVTHTDGFPVQPVRTDALLIGMGERYDVEVTLGDGVFPVVALAEGKDALGRALIRTGTGEAPQASHRPAELGKRVLGSDKLTAAEQVKLDARDVDQEIRVALTGGMERYDWGINGARFNMADPSATDPFAVSEGQRVRLRFVNETTMWHPMHLHGHTFQVNGSGARKDTVAVLPDQTVTADFDADNPGQWMIHCHNAYHQEAGMMGTLAYRA